MDMKRHLKSALKQLGLDKPRKAQIIPMNTLDAEQDAIVIAATGSGKQIIYETVGLAHSGQTDYRHRAFACANIQSGTDVTGSWYSCRLYRYDPLEGGYR